MDHSSNAVDTVKQNATDLEVAANYPIIVHCHLRWDFVWQRPQQFLSRLSQRHRILFVEGPELVHEEVAPSYTLKQAEGFPNVTIMQTKLPASRFGDGVWVDRQRYLLLQDALCGPLEGKFDFPVQWFYDPMAVTPFAGRMKEVAVVYDCMDELSKFKFAPPELIARERELLAIADVVFAGGRKMHESKSRHNSNCHFYGCGVDVEHFGKARTDEITIPEDLASVEGPVLGYFGVVDERLDYDLIARLADANPNWTVAMVGPTAKVDPNDLPKRANILWLGGRSYDQLPAYCKRFDVCMMPFALNEATEYINPTKALEYMATAKPIVSTGVADVISNFSEAVDIAANADEFVQMCQKAVEAPDQEQVERGLRMSLDNTWNQIVAKLEGHINDALIQKVIWEEGAGVLQSVANGSLATVGKAKSAEKTSANGNGLYNTNRSSANGVTAGVAQYAQPE